MMQLKVDGLTEKREEMMLMTRYHDVDRDVVITEDELRAEYENKVANGETEYDSFPVYREACMTYNNGSLEKIAEDWEINRLRREIAWEIVAETEIEPKKVLDWMESNEVFGNWTAWEIGHRPVDIMELIESAQQMLL